MKYKLVLLDRDGVINYPSERQKYVYEESDFLIYDDVNTFIHEVFKAGTKVAIITNQRGISLGIYTQKEVMNLHDILIKHCNIESHQLKIFFCPHDLDECECRKPKSGLLRQAIESESLSYSEVLFIGDQESDRLAAFHLDVDFIKLSRHDYSTDKKSLIEILEMIR